MDNIKNKEQIIQGWECHRCHTIHAPFVRECACSGNWNYTKQRCLWDDMPETSPGSGVKIGGLMEGRNEMSENIPAFPSVTNFTEEKGMTLRDYFASQALIGWVLVKDAEPCAKSCYEYADAMLKAREEVR